MMVREPLSLSLFFALLVFFLFQAGRLLSPFFGPILAALAVSIVCYPMHQWIGRRFKKLRPSLQALLSDAAVLLFIVVPVTFILTSMVEEVQEVLPEIKSHFLQLAAWVKSVQSGQALWSDHLPSWIANRIDLSGINLEETLLRFSQTLTGLIADTAKSLAGGILNFLLDILIFLLFLFFLFRDGPQWFRSWNESLPFPSELRTRLHERIEAVVGGILRGSLLTGLAQATFLLIGYEIVGARAAILLGALTALSSLIPGIGIGLVWVPLSVFYVIIGSFGKALVILIFGLIAGVLDNILRPLLVGQKANMPFVWFTFSVLGGLQIYGMKGLLLGPLVFAVLPILLEIYRSYVLKTRS